MGEPNVALNVYMSKKERIRDVYEFYMGEKVSDDLEIDVADEFYSLRDNKKLTFRERDILKKVQRPNGKKFLLGIENQMTINLTFPQRMLEMDSLEYKRQIEEIQEENEKVKTKYTKDDDFKYSFKKENRLKPVCNLQLYWGKEKLKTPLSLKDVMDMEALPEPMKYLFNDYRIHTVSMLEIPDQDLEKMKSDIRYVVGVLKRTGRGREYRQFILDHKEYFRKIPSDAYDVIDACAGIRELEKYLKYDKERQEEMNMCQALEELLEEGRCEGTQNSILDLLAECGELPEEIKERIKKEKNMDKLRTWLRLAAKAESIEKFCMIM